MSNVSGLKNKQRQDALIARIQERIQTGVHDDNDGGLIQYFLDECMQIETELMAVTAENTLLRGLLANGDKDCVYCGLPAADITKCKSGFPGCARMDDIMAAAK